MVGYQYMQQRWEGHNDGTERVSDAEVLQQFPVTHERMTMHMHMLMFMYGNHDDLTLMAMVPLMEMDMPHLTRSGDAFTTRARGLGDVQISAIVPVYDQYPSSDPVRGRNLPSHRPHRRRGLERQARPSGIRDATRLRNF
jgi:hypothetical protein